MIYPKRHFSFIIDAETEKNCKMKVSVTNKERFYISKRYRDDWDPIEVGRKNLRIKSHMILFCSCLRMINLKGERSTA
jgi:hypothetical protein